MLQCHLCCCFSIVPFVQILIYINVNQVIQFQDQCDAMFKDHSVSVARELMIIYEVHQKGGTNFIEVKYMHVQV